MNLAIFPITHLPNDLMFTSCEFEKQLPYEENGKLANVIQNPTHFYSVRLWYTYEV